jgi:7,8-dihydropterin-6-yl-methyl-4-(beta-D-ribofuranosyl)aminobenzene 5'-phosphate synthase
MIQNLSITVLVDNQSDNPELCREHGLSIWIEADDYRIIFDTGQSDLFLQNAETLGIRLTSANALVLSHGHYDHTGGVREILSIHPSISLYCHPDILIPRFSRQSDGTMKPIGISTADAQAVRLHTDSTCWITRPENINADIGIAGPIPRLTAYEDTGGDFFLDITGRHVDPIQDDLALWFRTRQGIVIVTGCCHSGLVNTLDYVSNICYHEKIISIIGGFHLLHATDKRLEQTYWSLHSYALQQVIALHCTGDSATDYLEKKLGSLFVKGTTGMKVRYGI